MTMKIKKLCLIIGLLVCLIVTLLFKAEVIHEPNGASNKPNKRAVLMQAVIGTGTHRMIQTTFKLLKPIQ